MFDIQTEQHPAHWLSRGSGNPSWLKSSNEVSSRLLDFLQISWIFQLEALLILSKKKIPFQQEKKCWRSFERSSLSLTTAGCNDCNLKSNGSKILKGLISLLCAEK